ncbi:NifB/NifX family molybdenum-iron cluster-binding protein [Porphyromonadaceae bacterium OttesenSCG-928-L07]|nr:NifB/NifX family molybdenum-iron cluster-binding protein [Porphyromonadaceae bacterium OttesenSCG-928-L07]MDL2252414.1 NifB/NifX family molybdenum-iron cluster-binding protein [Odoribacter sp. OttesenSCG-928-J03]
MKIAVPTRDNVVDDHFGHCAYYTIFTIGADNTIIATETLPSPEGCGCKSNIASVLHDAGVEVLLAGNMGAGALNVLKNNHIEVVRGCSGDVKQLAENYLKGDVKDSGEGCQNHEHHHDHSGGWHVCSH